MLSRGCLRSAGTLAAGAVGVHGYFPATSPRQPYELRAPAGVSESHRDLSGRRR